MIKIDILNSEQRVKLKYILIFIFVLALILRLAAVFHIADFKNPDMAEWGVIVKNILSGRGYSFYSVIHSNDVIPKFLGEGTPLPSVYMPPGYPLLLVGIFSIFGMGANSILIVNLLQAFLGAALCVLIYMIASKKFSPQVAFFSAVILACYPTFVYLPSQISSANLYIFLNCLLVLFLLKGEGNGRISSFIFAGLFMGLLILTRAQLIGYLPFIAIWIYLCVPKTKLKSALTFFVIALFVLMPWTIRNYYVFGKFVPVIKSAGYNLWRGNHEKATGAWHTTMPSEIEEKIINLSPSRDFEIKCDNIYLNRAVTFIRENPMQCLSLALKKFTFYWGYFWGVDLTYTGVKTPLYWLPWVIIVPFFAFGLCKTVNNFKKYSLFYLYFILATLVAMLFFVLPRYRMFIMPLIIPFSVHGAIELLRKIYNNLKVSY